jgi:hypothetical protein
MHPALPARRLTREEWQELADQVRALGAGAWMSDVKGFACESATIGNAWQAGTRSTRERVAEWLAEAPAPAEVATVAQVDAPAQVAEVAPAEAEAPAGAAQVAEALRVAIRAAGAGNLGHVKTRTGSPISSRVTWCAALVGPMPMGTTATASDLVDAAGTGVTCPACAHLVACRAGAACVMCSAILGDAPAELAADVAPAEVAQVDAPAPVAEVAPAEAPAPVATVTAPSADNVTTWAPPAPATVTAPAEVPAPATEELATVTTTPAPVAQVAEVAQVAPAEAEAPAQVDAPAAPVAEAPAQRIRVELAERGPVDGYGFRITGKLAKADAKVIKAALAAERATLGGRFWVLTSERGTVNVVPSDDDSAPADWSPVVARVAELLAAQVPAQV